MTQIKMTFVSDHDTINFDNQESIAILTYVLHP
jgi:hypothetical protein